jgi:hypothetical protein
MMRMAVPKARKERRKNMSKKDTRRSNGSRDRGNARAKKTQALCSKEFEGWMGATLAQTSDLFNSLVRLEHGICFTIIGRLPELVEKLPALRGDEPLIEAIVNAAYGAGYNLAKEADASDAEATQEPS